MMRQITVIALTTVALVQSTKLESEAIVLPGAAVGYAPTVVGGGLVTGGVGFVAPGLAVGGITSVGYAPAISALGVAPAISTVGYAPAISTVGIAPAISTVGAVYV